MRVGLRPSSPDQSLTLPELRPTFGRKLLDRERGSARHCGLNLLAHLSLGRSGTPLRGGGVLFRHAASLSGMSQLTACAISTSQGTRSGSGRGMRPSANALASSMRFWGKVQGAGRSLLTRQQDRRGRHGNRLPTLPTMPTLPTERKWQCGNLRRKPIKKVVITLT